MSCTSQIFTSIFSGLAGLLAGHLLAKKRDADNDQRRLRNELYGLLNTISFSLLTQYSQLYNLQKNLQSRLSIINDEGAMQRRNDRILALQAFSLDSSVIIKFEHISGLLGLVTNCFPSYQVNPGIFQCCYTSNKKYNEMIVDLKKYQEAKHQIEKEENPAEIVGALVNFLKPNIPIYLEMVQTYMPFIKTTQESLAELFALLDKKPLRLGDSIELWGSKS